MPDLLFILLLAMVMFGPKKLPGIAAQIGKYLAQFRQMKRELLDQLNAEMLQIDKENPATNDAGSPVLRFSDSLVTEPSARFKPVSPEWSLVPTTIHEPPLRMELQQTLGAHPRRTSYWTYTVHFPLTQFWLLAQGTPQLPGLALQCNGLEASSFWV